MSLDTSQLPIYKGDKPAKEDCSSDIHGDLAENSDVSYYTWGIFTIAYVSRYSIPSLPDLGAYHEPLQAFHRLLNDLWRLDKCCTILLMFCSLCIAVAPAFSLFFVHRVTLYVAQLGSSQVTHVMKDLQTTVFNWVILSSVFCGLEIVMSQAKIRARSCLRAHFIPRLVKARLIQEPNKDDTSFPYAHEYGGCVPTWEFIESFSTRLRNILVITANGVTLIIIIWQRQTAEITFLYALMAIFLAIIFIPMDATRGRGYTFWTNNSHYNRLMALFNIVFDSDYRVNVVRDGLVDILCQEYQKESDQLGAAGPDVWVIGCGTPLGWYWSLISALVANYPVALYIFFALNFTRSLNLASVAIFQYSLFTMRKSIKLQFATNGSFLDIMCRIQRFYDTLDVPMSKAQNEIAYPNKQTTHTSGMKISARGLCFNTISNVDLDIEPGKMIVITGGNGSGKTTLVKFLSGILGPSQGQIFIDGESISKYDPTQLKRSIVFVGQYETIYPVSVKENITMGLGLLDVTASDERIREAVRGVEASEIIKRLGFNTVLNPCSINAYSLNAEPGRPAVEVLRKHSPTTMTELPDGERQRIIAARALFRAMNGETIKLVIIDQATSALDDNAEFEIVMQFRKVARKRGQTLIIVTHRLSERLSTCADLILCLKDGRVFPA